MSDELHQESRWLADDGRLIGWRCSCGSWWKVYQTPWHQGDTDE